MTEDALDTIRRQILANACVAGHCLDANILSSFALNTLIEQTKKLVFTCYSCGKSHQRLDQLIACVEKHKEVQKMAVHLIDYRRNLTACGLPLANNSASPIHAAITCPTCKGR